ncbi:hypothetical protein BKI52_01730 [marine bacterium AO1-C]|nr:hypothetical protein BKI52_01730 [marine bacterium AO1-C]
MKKSFLTFYLLLWVLQVMGQADTSTKAEKKRLDFAKTYFEFGGSYFPSFKGKQILNNTENTFEHSASLNPYLNWGGFHFWGHAEFYVSFPLSGITQILNPNDDTSFEMIHSVATGARFYPWAFKEGSIRPYVGLSWSSLGFKQIIKPEENQPMLYKDFLLVPEVGLTYGYKSFALRLSASYFPANRWSYPVSKTDFVEINTPRFGFHAGLLYKFEASKNEDPKLQEKWNNYPRVSKLSTGATRFGDFFVGIGPSVSFSLRKSSFNEKNFPYLPNPASSENYFDIAIGYQFNKANLFTALSFRNPEFRANGHGTEQTVQKTSLLLEVNKFLTDYTGFAPYIGLNVAYDQIKYSEKTELGSREIISRKVEPGVTFGWDIVSGKTDEHFILRTNLRWYPLSFFTVEGQKFDFSQLEYNLIQLVFYPGRLKRKK